MNKDWKELTKERFRCIPSVYRICIGRWEGNSLDAIKEIQEESEIGRLLVDTERQYLTSIKDGWLARLL